MADDNSTIESEIAGRFGVLPNFFRLAPEARDVTSNLWGFAKFAYIDNPLPPLLKERLFVYLSLYCDVRYCISRHVGFLAGLGNPAGDPQSLPDTVEQAIELLSRPLPRGGELEPHLAKLNAAASPLKLTMLDDDLEESFIACATHVFLQSQQAGKSLSALQHALDPVSFQHLLVFVAFVRTALFWTEVHPELRTEKDVDDLLAVHERLAECVLRNPSSDSQTTEILLDELTSLRRERALREELQQTNFELQAERERLRVTLESIGDAVITTDHEGRVTYLNVVAENLTGWKRGDAVGRPLDDVFRIINEYTREQAVNPADKALREGVVVGLANHTLLISRSGQERPIDDSAAPITDEGGKDIGCILVFRDISQRRKWEKQNADRLRSSQLLASIVRSSEDAIMSKSLAGILDSWNTAAEQMFGYTAEEALGRHVSLIIPAEYADEEAGIIERISAGERVDPFDTVRQCKDGRRISVSLTVSPLYNPEGNIVGASSILRDISERKEMIDRLNQLAYALAESDRRKDEFLATLAHELRNPLAPIRTGLEVMRVVGRDADAHENARTILERQVSQMARLVDDLMDVSRINRGKIQLEKAPVELSTVINHAVETSRPLIEEMRHELVIDLPSGSLVIDVDMARLSQVLSNLLNNAAKYSEAESRIWLNAEAGDDAVEIRVRDAGIGLGAQNLARIFDMFSQVDQSTAKTRGGLGIGLTLAKTLVEMHGGSIVARSEGLGKGTEFVVRLPIDSGLGVAGTLRHTTEASSSASSFRILIIDDNRDAADSLQFLLENAGHQVMTAYDPHRGLELAEETRPDIIVLDIGLPSLDGFEVSRRIKRRDWSANCRIIAVTGWGTDEDRRKSRDTGIDYHLVKPVDPHTLMQLLAELDAN